MKTIIIILAVSAFTLASVEYDRHIFTNKEFLKAEIHKIEKSISSAENKMISAEMRMENMLEGNNSGIN